MSKYSNTIKQVARNSELGHEHRPNSSAFLMGVENKINSDGLRDKEYKLETSNRRIIFLGDSLTFGWGVKQEHIFANLIEEKLNMNSSETVEILNFGIGNYNLYREFLQFKEKGLKYNPDEVVLFFFINDAEVLSQASDSLLQYSQLATLLWSKFKVFGSKSTTKGFKEYYKDQFKGEGWTLLESSLKKLNSLCLANGIELKIVLLPELHNLKEYPFENEHKMVINLANSLNIKSFDTTRYFDSSINPMDYWVAPDDAHPNAKAHKVISDVIYNFIKESK